MTQAEKMAVLRAAFAAALKYHPQYGESPFPFGDKESTSKWRAITLLWRDVLNGGKLPPEITLNSNAGDCFAFWYTELRIGGDYYAIASQFFTRLFLEEHNAHIGRTQ